MGTRRLYTSQRCMCSVATRQTALHAMICGHSIWKTTSGRSFDLEQKVEVLCRPTSTITRRSFIKGACTCLVATDAKRTCSWSTDSARGRGRWCRLAAKVRRRGTGTRPCGTATTCIYSAVVTSSPTLTTPSFSTSRSYSGASFAFATARGGSSPRQSCTIALSSFTAVKTSTTSRSTIFSPPLCFTFSPVERAELHRLRPLFPRRAWALRQPSLQCDRNQRSLCPQLHCFQSQRLRPLNSQHHRNPFNSHNPVNSCNRWPSPPTHRMSLLEATRRTTARWQQVIQRQAPAARRSSSSTVASPATSQRPPTHCVGLRCPRKTPAAPTAPAAKAPRRRRQLQARTHRRWPCCPRKKRPRISDHSFDKLSNRTLDDCWLAASSPILRSWSRSRSFVVSVAMQAIRYPAASTVRPWRRATERPSWPIATSCSVDAPRFAPCSARACKRR